MRWSSLKLQRNASKIAAYPMRESPGSCLDDLRLRLTESEPEEILSRLDLRVGADGRGKQVLLFDFVLPFILRSLSNKCVFPLLLVSIFSSQKNPLLMPFRLHDNANCVAFFSPKSFLSIGLHPSAAMFATFRYVIIVCGESGWRSTHCTGKIPYNVNENGQTKSRFWWIKAKFLPFNWWNGRRLVSCGGMNIMVEFGYCSVVQSML